MRNYMRRKYWHKYLALTVPFALSFVLFHTPCKYTAQTAASAALPAVPDDLYEASIFGSRSFSNLVVSVVAEEESLYGEETGIISSQYMQRGAESEREIRLFIYDQDGTPLIRQNAGIRVSGAASRTAPRKSFRIIARKEYDKSFPAFTYDLWGGRTTVDGRSQPIDKYSSFILHAVRLDADSTGIHNSVGYELARKAGIVDASPTTPAAFYINGVYQGAYFLMPAKNDHAIAELYNIADPGQIELVSVFEGEKTGEQTHPEVLEEYLNFVSFVQNSDVNDPSIIAAIERQMDVEQYLRYCAVNLLLANGDWSDNNLMVWRCQNNGFPYQDGRWRFFLFDLDWIGSPPELVADTFQSLLQTNDNYNLLHSLMENPEWRQQFRDIIYEMEETTFYMESIEGVFAREEARMLDEITYDFQSESFPTYLRYSVNSDPVTAEDYITLDDRGLLIENFKSNLLKAPEMVNECLRVYLP